MTKRLYNSDKEKKETMNKVVKLIKGSDGVVREVDMSDDELDKVTKELDIVDKKLDDVNRKLDVLDNELDKLL